MSFDMDSLDAPGATGSYDSMFHSKAITICDALTGGHQPMKSEAAAAAAANTAAAATVGTCQGEQQLQPNDGIEGSTAPRKGAAAAAPEAASDAADGADGDGLAVDGYQFGFVHIKAVDDTGHDRMTANKVRGCRET